MVLKSCAFNELCMFFINNFIWLALSTTDISLIVHLSSDSLYSILSISTQKYQWHWWQEGRGLVGKGACHEA